MIATHLGFYNTSSSRTHVRFQFSTHAAAGGNVAPNSAFEAADLRIYKATDGAAFSATQRSSANGITMTSPFDSLTGFHDVDIDLTDNTDASFYAAGSLYSVVLAPDETVDGQTLTGVVLAYFEIGVQPANVTQFGGTAGTFASGRPEVNTSHIAGSAVSTSSAQIGVNVVNAGGTAWGSGAITAGSIASNAITSAKVATDAIGAAQLAADAVTEITDATKTALGYVTGTADSGTTTTMVDAALTQADTDYWKGSTIVFTSGTISGQARLITGFTPASDTVTFAPATTQAVGTNTYIIVPAARVDVELWDGSAVNALSSGRVDVSVGAMATDVLTSTALAASAVTEIQSGLSTLDAAGVRSAVGLASANLDTQLTAIDDYLDTEVAAIKTVTDAIGATGTGLTAIPWNAAWDAEVQSEVADALAVYDPPTKAELDTAVANVSVDEIQATAIADLFNTDSGTTYASAVAGSAVKEIADNAGGSALTEAGIADAVWDEAIAGHLTAGSTGNALNAAGSAGDPWATAIPGAYGAGTAGKILGDNINATISSRATQTSVDTIDDFLDTEVAAIKAKTDQLTFTTANQVDARTMTNSDKTGYSLTATTGLGNQTSNITGNLSGSVGSVTGSVGSVVGLTASNLDATISSRASQASLDTLDDYVDTEVAAIKAKTDSLTFTVAGQVDANVQYVNDAQVTGNGQTGTEWGPA